MHILSQNGLGNTTYSGFKGVNIQKMLLLTMLNTILILCTLNSLIKLCEKTLLQALKNHIYHDVREFTVFSSLFLQI